MAAGNRFVADAEHRAGCAAFTQHGLQTQSIRRSISMGNANGGGLVLHQLVIFFHQRLQRPLLAAELAIQDNFALLVALQNGLDLQQGACQTGTAGDAAAAMEVFQVVHHKILLHLAAAGAGKGHQFIQRFTLPGQLGRFQHHQPLAKRRAAGVDYHHPAGFVVFGHFLTDQINAPAGAADTAGNSQIQHIVSGL